MKSISADFTDALKRSNWNGNIRELKNVVERCVILMDNEELNANNLPIELKTVAQNGESALCISI